VARILAEYGGLLAVLAGYLALTLAIEVPVAWFLGFRKRREIAIVVLANVLTNPALVYYLLLVERVTARSGPTSELIVWLITLFAEAGVVFVEAAVIIWALKRPRKVAIGAAAIMNVASFVGGWLIQRWT
jgi:hypothetical protein